MSETEESNLICEIEKKQLELNSLRGKLSKLRGEIEVEIKTEWIDRKKGGAPFFAILTKGSKNNLVRRFVEIPKIFSSESVMMEGRIRILVGLHYDMRRGGTFRNDMREYGVVGKDGLEKLTLYEVERRLGVEKLRKPTTTELKNETEKLEKDKIMRDIRQKGGKKK